MKAEKSSKKVMGSNSEFDERARMAKMSTIDLHRHRNRLNEGYAKNSKNTEAGFVYLRHLKIVDDEIILRGLVND